MLFACSIRYVVQFLVHRTGWCKRLSHMEACVKDHPLTPALLHTSSKSPAASCGAPSQKLAPIHMSTGRAVGSGPYKVTNKAQRQGAGACPSPKLPNPKDTPYLRIRGNHVGPLSGRGTSPRPGRCCTHWLALSRQSGELPKGSRKPSAQRRWA